MPPPRRTETGVLLATCSHAWSMLLPMMSSYFTAGWGGRGSPNSLTDPHLPIPYLPGYLQSQTTLGSHRPTSPALLGAQGRILPSRQETFFFPGPPLWHMEGPWLEVRSELQLPTYATATATSDPSHIFKLCRSMWQHRILNH